MKVTWNLAVLATLTLVVLGCGKKDEINLPINPRSNPDAFQPDPLRVHLYSIGRKHQPSVGEDRPTHFIEVDYSASANYRVFYCSAGNCAPSLEIRCIEGTACPVYTFRADGVYRLEPNHPVQVGENFSSKRRRVEVMDPQPSLHADDTYYVVAIAPNGRESIRFNAVRQ